MAEYSTGVHQVSHTKLPDKPSVCFPNRWCSYPMEKPKPSYFWWTSAMKSRIHSTDKLFLPSTTRHGVLESTPENSLDSHNIFPALFMYLSVTIIPNLWIDLNFYLSLLFQEKWQKDISHGGEPLQSSGQSWSCPLSFVVTPRWPLLFHITESTYNWHKTFVWSHLWILFFS